MKENKVCSVCGAVLTEENTRSFDGQVLCEHCFNEHTTTCDNCGERIWSDNAEGDSAYTLCSHCYDYCYTNCEDCGRLIHNEDAFYEDGEDYPYCLDCFEKLKNNAIKNYSYKPEPIFYGSGNLFYGVELEIDKGGEYYCSPQKLATRDFSYNEILDVIASELDRQYFGVEITDKFADLSRDEFIAIQLKNMQNKYNFLIFIGEGELINGIPSVIKTRFKNRIHRSIYLEMQYQDGKGVITDCHYYYRNYRERSKVIPETLSTVFLEYNRQTILNIINNELNTAFTHIIFVTDGSLNIDNKVALCGNV